MSSIVKTHPQFLQYWNYEKNINISPSDVGKGSHTVVWWKCDEGHEFENMVHRVVNGNSWCPYCSGRKIGYGNDLETKFPKIAKLWDYEKNGDLKPSEVFSRSNKKVWWLCVEKEYHTYEQQINTKTVQRCGCPYCSHRKVHELDSIIYTNPELCEDWDYKRNKIKPSEVTKGSDRRVWWKCKDCGHRWKTTIKNRVRGARDGKGTGCPKCNPAYVKTKYEDSVAYHFPHIVKQLHPTNNGDIDPSNIRSWTLRKYWFICDYGHEWKTTMHSRSSGSNCPDCHRSTSSVQIFIYAGLDFLFDDVKHSEVVHGKELDIFIKDYDVGIEYDGNIFHKKKEEIDLNKNKVMEDNNILLIRVRDHRLNKLTPKDILYKGLYGRRASKSYLKIVHKILNRITKEIKLNSDLEKQIIKYIELNEPQNLDLYNEMIIHLPRPPLEKSLLKTHPKIAETWDYERNDPLKPEMFTYGSEQIMLWLCDEGHDYDMSIKRRSRGENCPYCISSSGSRRRVGFGNDLKSLYPKIVEEYWDFEHNEIEPSKVSPGSHKRAYFKCTGQNPPHEKGCYFDQEIRIFVKWGVRCPYCDGKRVGFGNDLETHHPDITKEFHPTKNGEISPKDIHRGTSKKYWWICSDGHEWKTKVSSRTNSYDYQKGNDCPTCYELSRRK
jgi:hypothetical protein